MLIIFKCYNIFLDTLETNDYIYKKSGLKIDF